MNYDEIIDYFVQKITDFGYGEFGFQYENGEIFVTLFGFVGGKKISKCDLRIYNNGIDVTKLSDYEIVGVIQQNLTK